MTQPLSEADILFPHLANTPNFSSTLSSLKRSTLSVHNRLASIISDGDFVNLVAEAYQLPLVANERCGSWYIPSEKKTGGVYFKSTDGHMNQWGFSLRRLNLQLLDIVQKYGGAVIVDSTRRGKSMPDALSKTIPIWCCVINRAVFDGEKHALYTPPHAVSESEHAQIESRLDRCVQQFLDICKPKLSELRANLQKPLRPIWVTHQSTLPEAVPAFVAFHPIVLCTASRRVNGAEASEGGYVQGAADDHEAWSHGLTPPVFWKHKDVLMTTSEEDAPALISKLIDEEAENSTSTAATLVSPTCNLYISSTQNIDLAPFDAVVSCAPKPFAPDMLKAANTTHSLNLKCQTGKLGSRDLRTTLPLLAPFLSTISIPSPKILLCCPTGTDLAVGTALAILCLYASDSGVIDLGITRSARDIDKHFIKQRLAWITTSNPALNPSRATLQSVNSTLLTNLDPKTAALPTRLPTDPAAATVPAIPVLPDPQTTSRPEPSTPARIFTHLANHTWCFHRHLTSALPSHPSGTVSGTATLTPHLAAAVPTLVYAEDGTFTTTTGLTMRAKRRYVYQLTSPSSGDGGDGIVVRFFDDDAAPGHALGPRGEGVGGVFVEMGVLGRSGEEGVWEAKSRETHLCGEDLYAAGWRFGGGMVGAGEGMWWEVRYDVSGPRKGYVSSTRYEPVKA